MWASHAPLQFRFLFLRATVLALALSCPAIAGATDDLTIAIISRGTAPGFFTRFSEGAQEAAHELAAGGTLIRLIPFETQHPGDRNQQAKLIQQATQECANGILLDPVNRKDPIAAVNGAAALKAPIVLFDSGLDSSAPVARVSIDNREAGRMAAKYLATLLGGKGNVLLLRYFIHSSNAEDREEGFLEVMSRDYPDIHIVASDFHAGATREAAKRVSATLLHMHGATLNGIFASSEPGTQGMIDALHGAGLAGGKIKLIGTDETSPSLVPEWKAGDIQGFICQDAFAMGRASLHAIVSAATGKKPNPMISTPMTLVTNDGIQFAPSENASATTRPAKPVALLQLQLPANLNDKPPSIQTPVDFTIPDLKLAMVAISPGTFQMGPPKEGDNRGDETPSTTVTLSGFWIGKYELTQAQWRAVMGSNPSDFLGDDRPVENICWNDAIEFCRRLTQRERTAGRLPAGYVYTLPTEAQ